LNGLAAQRDVAALRQIGFDQYEIDRRRAAVSNVFQRLMADLKRVLASRPSQAFVLRPHPFEDSEGYRRLFEEYSNLTVDDAGEVFPVLSAAQAVVQVNCSTAIEATMLRRVPLSPEYVNNDVMRSANPLPSCISYRASSPEELDRTLDGLEEVAAQFAFEENYARHIEPWFHFNDGQAAARVADAVLRRIREPRGRRHLRLSLASGRQPASISQHLQGLASNVVGTGRMGRLRDARDPGRRVKRFTAKKVTDTLGLLAAAEGATFAPTARISHHPITGMALLSVEVSSI
jgi:hypothetical protein